MELIKNNIEEYIEVQHDIIKIKRNNLKSLLMSKNSTYIKEIEAMKEIVNTYENIENTINHKVTDDKLQCIKEIEDEIKQLIRDVEEDEKLITGFNKCSAEPIELGIANNLMGKNFNEDNQEYEMIKDEIKSFGRKERELKKLHKKLHKIKYGF
jgi:Mg2+ and Co2+ transporter CorA